MADMTYVVTMYRYGSRERHSYVLGVFTKKTKAEKAETKEQEYRGSTKYYPEILECPLNETLRDDPFKVVMELDQNPHFKEG